MKAYKVGQTVRIRKDLKKGWYGETMFIPDMKEYRGKKARIITAGESSCRLSVDNKDYLWSAEMLEPISRKIEDGLKEGDIIVDKKGNEKKVVLVYVYLENIIFNDKTYFFYLNQLIKNGYTLKNQEAEPETIEILGKKYLKSEVEKKIKKLKEVK
jgi:hypothetical protein